MSDKISALNIRPGYEDFQKEYQKRHLDVIDFPLGDCWVIEKCACSVSLIKELWLNFCLQWVNHIIANSALHVFFFSVWQTRGTEFVYATDTVYINVIVSLTSFLMCWLKFNLSFIYFLPQHRLWSTGHRKNSLSFSPSTQDTAG